MNGYSSHTFSLIKAKNELFYVKWHFQTKQGIKNLTREQAAELAGVDPDYAQRDLPSIEDSLSRSNGTTERTVMFVISMPARRGTVSVQKMCLTPWDHNFVQPVPVKRPCETMM